ncbi:lipid II:glycine glycyltransferase FemX [Desulfobacterium sp. N47]|uniref:BioF2-like acetyltransferase domain-containing protein n=1 Tax=uncultured Desulfobacterium sp. TaxID=201089 RepID=E1YJF7_9BACT|nr:hypothetical protein N47_E49230 [uncultured Desulfobacterium sp.]
MSSVSSDFQILNPEIYEKWDDEIDMLQNCSFFHSIAWSKVLSDSYDYRPCYFVSYDKKKLSSVVPIMDIKSFLTGRRGVSLPFTDYCDPLISEGINSQEIFERIVQYAKNHNWKFIEFRGGGKYFPEAIPSSDYLGHRINLSCKEPDIYKQLKNTFKRNIKKAVTSGISINFFTTLKAVKEFYRLNCITRKRHGLPPQPYRFFKKIYKHIVSEKLGVVVLASYNKICIAGAVFFHFGNKAVYKYGASDIKYQSLRANNLVMWEAIKWYIKKEFKSLSLGRTEPENHGLRQFKLGMGAEEYFIKYYRYDLKSGSFVREPEKVSPFQTKIFSKLPVVVLKFIGTFYYRHAG